MLRPRRNIGAEILQGLREIKRGEHGRKVNVPDIASIGEKAGSRRRGLRRARAGRV